MMRLALVVALAGLASAGCYAPDLRDCTVTCSAADECSGDQVCTGGFCVADGATCMGGGVTPDAPAAMIMLRVDIEGTGKVVIESIGECTDQRAPCTWMVPAQQMRLDARQVESDKPFERWTTVNCAPATQPTCTLAPTSSTTVGAKFK